MEVQSLKGLEDNIVGEPQWCRLSNSYPPWYKGFKLLSKKVENFSNFFLKPSAKNKCIKVKDKQKSKRELER